MSDKRMPPSRDGQAKDEIADRFPSQAEGEEETVDKDLEQKGGQKPAENK